MKIVLAPRCKGAGGVFRKFLKTRAEAVPIKKNTVHCYRVVNSISIEETIVKRNPIDTKKNVDLSESYLLRVRSRFAF